MKKKLLILVIAILTLLFIGYKFIYKEHRNIAEEKASIVETVALIYSAFSTDETNANTKYLDKTIEVKGIITSINETTKNIMLDSKLNALFDGEIPTDVKINDSIVVKGRLVGYDSLLEEIQMDQCSKK